MDKKTLKFRQNLQQDFWSMHEQFVDTRYYWVKEYLSPSHLCIVAPDNYFC